MLRSEHKWEGYGVYWVLIEMMFESESTSLQHKNLKGIAEAYNIPLSKLEAIINTAMEEKLFVSNGEEFWSESLRNRKNNMEYIKLKQSEAGKKAMQNRYKNNKPNKSAVSDLEGTCNNKRNKIKEIKIKIKEDKLEDIPEIIINTQENIYTDILNYLNEKTGKQFKVNGRKNISMIKARLNEKYTFEDFKKVIDIKTAEWLNNPEMEKYLCPETLFSPKFEKYLNQKLIDRSNGRANNKTDRPATISDLDQSARNFEATYGKAGINSSVVR